MVLLVLSALLTLSGVVYYLPQLVWLWRSGAAAGLSPAGQVSGSIAFVAWCAYLWAGGEWALLVPTLIGAAIWMSSTVLVVRRLPVPRWVFPVAVAYAGLLAGCLWVGGWVPFGSVIAFSGGVSYLPCAVDALRSSSVAGLSRMSWTFAFLDEAGWLTYGWLSHDRVVLLYGLLAVPGPLIVAVRAYTGPRSGLAPNPTTT